MQAQWKQHLGVTVALRNMEWKTFLSYRARREYKGFARGSYGADYMDPYSFLSLFATAGGGNATGWFDPRYVEMLGEANREAEQARRYEKLSRAERYLAGARPVIPLATAAVNWVKKPYVKGMYPNPGSLFAWKYVYIEHDPEKWDYGTPDMR